MSRFDSKRTEVVHRMSLDGTGETTGNVHENGIAYTVIYGVYGKDYIVHESDMGFVESESYVSGTGDARRQFEAIEEGLAEYYDAVDTEPDDDRELENREWADELRREEAMLDRLMDTVHEIADGKR